MNKSILLATILFALTLLAHGQLQTNKHVLTEQDTLRGSITPERAWWDLNYYHLDMK